MSAVSMQMRRHPVMQQAELACAPDASLHTFRSCCCIILDACLCTNNLETGVDCLRLPVLRDTAHKTLTDCVYLLTPLRPLQILVPLLYLALVTAAGCFVAGLLMLSTLASDELRDVLSGTLADVGECISGCACWSDSSTDCNATCGQEDAFTTFSATICRPHMHTSQCCTAAASGEAIGALEAAALMLCVLGPVCWVRPRRGVASITWSRRSAAAAGTPATCWCRQRWRGRRPRRR